MIDLRSDTVTRPTPEMRRAMSEAEVGDDVYGEDPTVIRLQEEAARRLGFEAALWVPTGVMGNEIAIRILTRPGQEVLADARSHVVQYEMAGWSHVRRHPGIVHAEDGLITAADTAPRAPPAYTVDRGIRLENTQTRRGDGGRRGRCGSHQRRHEAGVPVHVDGAACGTRPPPSVSSRATWWRKRTPRW